MLPRENLPSLTCTLSQSTRIIFEKQNSLYPNLVTCLLLNFTKIEATVSGFLPQSPLTFCRLTTVYTGICHPKK